MEGFELISLSISKICRNTLQFHFKIGEMLEFKLMILMGFVWKISYNIGDFAIENLLENNIVVSRC